MSSDLSEVKICRINSNILFSCNSCFLCVSFYLFSIFLSFFLSIPLCLFLSIFMFSRIFNRLFNGPSTASFCIFQTNITNLTTICCENVHIVSRAGGSNPLPLERESPPITTRPGLVSNIFVFPSLFFYFSDFIFLFCSTLLSSDEKLKLFQSSLAETK